VVEETAGSNPAGTSGRGAEVGVTMGHVAAWVSLSLARGSVEGVAVVTVAGILEATTLGIMVDYLIYENIYFRRNIIKYFLWNRGNMPNGMQ